MDGSLGHLMFIASINSVISVKSFLTQTTMSIDVKMPHDFNFTLLCSNGFLSLSKYGIYKKNEVRTIFVCLSVQLFDPVSSKICFWFGIIGFCCHGDHRSYNCSNLLVLTWDIWLLVFTPGLGRALTRLSARDLSKDCCSKKSQIGLTARNLSHFQFGSKTRAFAASMVLIVFGRRLDRR